jgi:hypothetical protein
MHYNKALLQHANAELRDQASSMSQTFNSVDFCEAFAANYPLEYEWLVQRYTQSPKHWDRPHAVQIAHREITHTLKNKYSDLVQKVGEAPNPRGGTMSLWRRIY